MHYEYISILKFDFGNCIKFLIWHNDNMGNDVVEINDSKILTFDSFETAKKFTDLENCDLYGYNIPNERIRKSDRIYNKLFFGNNFPAITPEGECFKPIFTKTDRKITKKILSYGLYFLEKHIER